MPLALFEAACVLVIALTLALMARARPAGALGREYAALALGAWLGEESCIALYRFYEYADGWHLRVVDVPLLVPLIWPLVVMSAREVARALVPHAGALTHALVTGAIVVFDASLVEVVAVRAGLWRWSEPGHLGVPLVGMLGWGFFAAGASFPARARWSVVTGPVVAHALILASWWLLFRHTLRGELGLAGGVGLGVLALAAFVWVVVRRRAGFGLAPRVWLPRVCAALLFVALLVTTDPTSAPLWAHAGLVALPYLTATRLRT